MSGPRAILWDWDNTLIDGWAAIAHALNVVFVNWNMPTWSISETRARVRGSLRDTFPDMFGPSWPEAGKLFYSTFSQDHLQHLAPMPGAKAALAATTAWPQGVVSNKAGDPLRAEVEHLGWTANFGAIIGAGDAAEDKPAAAPILLALERMGITPDRSVWYCGDTAIDMQAARAAGCTAVLIGDASHDAAIPDLCFVDLFTFMLHLRRLASGDGAAT